MGGVTLINGAMPLLLVLSLGSSSPFLFGLIFSGALLVSVTLYNVTKHRIILNSVQWYQTFKRLYSSSPRFRRSVLFGVLTSFDWPLYAFALLYINPTIIAIVMGVVPLMNMLNLVRTRNPRTTRSHRREINVESAVLILTALAGLAITVLATSSTYSYASLDRGTLIGLGAALLAAILQSLGAYEIRIGTELTAHLPESAGTDPDGPVPGDSRAGGNPVELATTLIGLVGTTIVALPAFAVVIAADLIFDLTGTGASLSPATLVGAIIAGGVLSAAEQILFRIANLETAHIGINAIGYLTPVTALCFLGIGSLLDVVDIGSIRLDYLTIGTLTIISVNLLLNVGAETRAGAQRYGFRMFVLSILLFGSFIYIRDLLIGTERLQWDGQEYIGLLTLAATVFTLILSFRISRLTNRIDLEDQQTISLYRRVEALVRAGILPAGTLDHIRQLDIALEPEVLAEHYDLSHRSLTAAEHRFHAAEAEGQAPTNTYNKLQDLREAHTEMDILVQSRQHGRGFAELLALAVVAALAVAVTLMVRPAGLVPVALGAGSGMTGFVLELFGVMLGAIICFLLFHLFDLRRERRLPLFQKTPDGAVRIVQREATSRRPERVVAMATGIAVTAIMITLLYHKWSSAGSLVW